jgi:hypothetical protein
MRSTWLPSLQGDHGQKCIHLVFNVAALFERQRIETSGVFDKRIHELGKLRPDTGPSNDISVRITPRKFFSQYGSHGGLVLGLLNDHLVLDALHAIDIVDVLGGQVLLRCVFGLAG